MGGGEKRHARTQKSEFFKGGRGDESPPPSPLHIHQKSPAPQILFANHFCKKARGLPYCKSPLKAKNDAEHFGKQNFNFSLRNLTWMFQEVFFLHIKLPPETRIEGASSPRRHSGEREKRKEKQTLILGGDLSITCSLD